MSLSNNTWVFDEKTGKLWYGPTGGSLALVDTVEVRLSLAFNSATTTFVPEIEAVVRNTDEGALILAQSSALGNDLSAIACSVPTSTRRSAKNDTVVTVRNNIQPYTILAGTFPTSGVYDSLDLVDAPYKQGV